MRPKLQPTREVAGAVTLSFGAVTDLGEGQKSERASGQARGREGFAGDGLLPTAYVIKYQSVFQ
jgi:hypothetical protein